MTLTLISCNHRAEPVLQQSDSPSGPTPLSAECQRVAKEADEFLSSQVPSHAFNGVAAIYKTGELCLQKGYGMANFEKSIPNQTENSFLLGSNSKRLAAMSILILEQEGLLKTSDFVSSYLADFTGEKAKITIEQLVKHTSGLIRDLESDPEHPGTEPIALSEIVRLVSLQPLLFEPGSKYSYSNTEYNMLAAIIEKVSGKPYWDFLKIKLFQPLGMNETLLEQSPLHPNQSQPHRWTPILNSLAPAKIELPSWGIGAGEFVSTLKDMHLLNLALMNHHPILTESQWVKMTTPGLENYAYGVEVRRLKHPQTSETRLLTTHDGSLGGSLTYFGVLDDRTEIILLQNIRKFPKYEMLSQSQAPTLIKILYNIPH